MVARARLDSELARVEVNSRLEWRRWLEKHHEQPQGVWLVTYKKAADLQRYVPYDTIVEEALCFGWIDSLPRALDRARSMRLVAPRNAKSAWSKVNKARVARLIAEKRMAPAGLRAVERAKKDGSWARLDAVESLTIPPDLAASLARQRQTADFFEAFPRSSKRLILEWISNARKPETRAKRIAETVRLAAKNERANRWSHT